MCSGSLSASPESVRSPRATTWSDGSGSIQDMADAAAALGYLPRDNRPFQRIEDRRRHRREDQPAQQAEGNSGGLYLDAPRAGSSFYRVEPVSHRIRSISLRWGNLTLYWAAFISVRGRRRTRQSAISTHCATLPFTFWVIRVGVFTIFVLAWLPIGPEVSPPPSLAQLDKVVALLS